MRSPPRAPTVALLLLAGSAGSVAGQWADVRDLPASAAQVALGHAHPLIGSTSNVIFVHPGLLDRGAGFGALVGWDGEDGTHIATSAAGPWWGGGVGVGVSTWTAAGTPGRSQSRVTLGFAREVAGGVSVGAAATLTEVRNVSDRERNAALDIGAARTVGPAVLAVSVLGVGEGPGDPRTSLAVATRRRPLGPFDVAGAGHVTRETNGTVTPGGGIDVSWWPVQGRRFVGRVGVRRVPDDDPLRMWTLGAAFEGDEIVLEYAYQDSEDEGALHRLGVRWR